MEPVMIQCFNWNRLHMAASQGKVRIFKKLLDRHPELAEALDSQQRSPLHLASANGHVEIVKILAKANPKMCLACDRDGLNPFHVAAVAGQVGVVDALFKANPSAARARVDKREGDTILHLCVKYYQLDFLQKLLKECFIGEEFVNARDHAGNTILHLAVAVAVAKKNCEMIKYVLHNTKIEVNATNASKHTAMDILLLRRRENPEEVDCKIEKLLQNLHAKRGKDIANPKWLTEQRNILIIVAVLMATIAFQAGVTPPGGVWPETKHGHQGGEAVMAYKNPNLYRYFLIFNTLSFFASLSTILLLIIEPFKKRRYVWMLIVVMFITMASMAATYTLIIAVITPKWDRKALCHSMILGVAVWSSVIAIVQFVPPVHPVWLIENIVSDEKKRVCKSQKCRV